MRTETVYFKNLDDDFKGYDECPQCESLKLVMVTTTTDQEGVAFEEFKCSDCGARVFHRDPINYFGQNVEVD